MQLFGKLGLSGIVLRSFRGPSGAPAFIDRSLFRDKQMPAQFVFDASSYEEAPLYLPTDANSDGWGHDCGLHGRRPGYGQGVPAGEGNIYTIAQLQAVVAQLCETNPGLCVVAESETPNE